MTLGIRDICPGRRTEQGQQQVVRRPRQKRHWSARHRDILADLFIVLS